MAYANTQSGIATQFSFTRVFSTAFNAVAAWNDTRITRKSLSKLSARELEDIGLSFGDIEAIATRSAR